MQKNILLGLVAAVFMLVVGITLVATQAGDILGGDSGTASTTVTVGNEAPAVQSLVFSTTAYGVDNLTSSGILPAIGTDRVIHVTGVISDANGESDLASTSLTLYRSGVASACGTDKNNCYKVMACDTNSAYGNDTEVAYDCPVAIAYWTDATDAGGRYPSEIWRGNVFASDAIGATTTREEEVEVTSLLALTIPEDIDYGVRSLGEQSTATSDVEMILTQRGNTSADVEVSGLPMACSIIGQIPVSGQGWSLTSVDYASATSLSGTPADTNRNIGYRDDDLVTLQASLYWSIGVPLTGVKGICSGANTVSVVANPMPELAVVVTEAPPQRLATVGLDRTYYIPASSDLYSWGIFVNNNDPFEFVASSSPAYWVDVDGSSDINTFGYATYAVDSTGNVYSTTGFSGAGGEISGLTLRGDISGVDMIRAGDRGSVFAVKTNGTLWARGANDTGQLCLGDTTDRTNFTQVGADTDWAWIETGSTHTVAVKTDGTLWACGQNDFGQLGIGNTTEQTTFVQVGTSTDWKYAFAGNGLSTDEGYTVAITTGGSMFAWGSNAQGKLGVGDTTDRLSPVQVGSDTNWIYASPGYEHTLALKTTGTLWSWGFSDSGRLGLGNLGDQFSPTQIGSDAGWRNISAGRRSSFAYKTTSTSTYFGWGSNTNNALGVETYPDSSLRVPTEILIRQ